MMDIEEARRVLRVEAQSILEAVEKLGPSFAEATTALFNCKGKVIVTGIGKSGHIGRKISSTLSSTGTPSVFLHPAESTHGDMGVLAEGDVLIGISVGGEAEEMKPILNFAVRRGIPVISMTGQRDSSLGRSGIFIDISVKEEACPLGLAPTSSSTVTLALGDALAMAVLRRRGFSREDFAEFHPSGRLGRRLLTRVKDLMHMGDSLPLVGRRESMTKVLSLMTKKEVRGVAGVLADDGALAGIITDGDIRRRLERDNSAFTETAEELMSQNPKTIDGNEFAEKALFLMEQFRIQSLFVIDKGAGSRRPVGLIHMQDLLGAGIR
jgi:arabinose-5-phosphate isomerase